MDYRRSPEQIVAMWRERQKQRGAILSQMEKVRDQYRGDIAVPLPELDKSEQSFVANLLQQGVDNYGARIASVAPDLVCPPTDPRKKTSLDRADIRRRANLAWWQENRVRQQLRRRARWLVAYACAPVAIRPDFERGIPRWEPRNPLCAFPAYTLDPDDPCPDDTIYATRRSLGQIRKSWPVQARLIAPEDDPDTRMVTVLEYDDAEQTTMLAVGEHKMYDYAEACVLDSAPNRAGIALSVVPGRITLDRLAGQFDGMLGMHLMQARLMALEVIAVQKGVFPTTYLLGRPGESPAFISGPHDGASGLVNIVEGGEIREVSPNPSFATNQTIDRLERGMRLTGGVVPEMGGESSTGIRTGRRGEQIMSAAVDFPIQEAQDTLAVALEEENRRATKVAREYFPTAKSFHVNWKGAKGHVTYTPAKDFDSDYTTVTYPQPGADINNLTIAIGQRVGVGTMSKKTGMHLDPMIDDPELEHDTIVAEGLEMALLQGIQTMAAAGQIPPADLARIMQLVQSNQASLVEAVERVQREAQERQATETSEGAPDAVAPGAPEAQPGLAPPGVGAEAGTVIPESPTALGRLDQFLMQMRGVGAGAA